MKQDYHSFILSRLLDLRNQHQRAYKQIVEKCIAESIFTSMNYFLLCSLWQSCYQAAARIESLLII